MQNNIVIFDGVCNLCNWSVQFIIKRDSQGIFKFAAAQSKIGKKLLRENHIELIQPESVTIIKDGKIFQKSSAALEIATKLDGIYKILVISYIVPRPVRDAIYDWIAQNRYRWFGKKDYCMVPDEKMKDRFLT